MKNKTHYFFVNFFLVGLFVIACSKMSIPSNVPISPTFGPEKFYPSSTVLDDLTFETGTIDLVLVKYVDNIGVVRFPAKCLVAYQQCEELEINLDSPPPSYPTPSDEVQIISSSPDGQWSIGTEIVKNQPPKLLILMRPDGTQIKELFRAEEGFISSIGWSTSSHYLFSYFGTIRDGTESISYEQILLYDLQTQEIQQIGQNIHYQHSAGWATLSPEGTRVLYTFSNSVDEPTTVVVYNLQDNSELSFQLSFPYDINWSPDGNWLVLVGPYEKGSTDHCDIQMIHPDGSERQTVFSSLWNEGCRYTWSRDNKYLLVSGHTVTPSVPRLYLVSLVDQKTYLVELPDIGIDFDRGIPNWNP